MKDLFGLELPTAVTFAIAFVVVLTLIGLLAWAVRRFGATRLEASRSRQPRLAVVDSAAVDGRRKLVIVRRDNVEHLLMIGGPTDVVVESSIVRGGAVATRDAPAARAGADNLPRAMPLPDSTLWPLQPEPTLAPAPAPAPAPLPAPAPPPAVRAERTVRVAIDPRIITKHRPAPEARPEPRLAPEPRIPAPEPRIAPAVEPTHWPAAQAEPARAQHADHLADLARPQAPAPQPVPAVAPAPAALTHADAPAAGGDQNLAEMAQRVAAAAPKSAAQPKPQYDNLEQEMASLLGRPGKT